MHARDTVLLLIDLQVAFCDGDGSMAGQGRDISAMREAAGVCNALAASARRADVPVIWTKMAFSADYSDGGVLTEWLRPNLARVGALRRGTNDAELAKCVVAHGDDVIIEKPRYSALLGTPIEVRLRSLGASRILVAGVTTSMCVDTTVRDLSQRDYKVFVVRDGCADFDRNRHQAALAAMEFGFARIVSRDAAVEILEGRSDE